MYVGPSPQVAITSVPNGGLKLHPAHVGSLYGPLFTEYALATPSAHGTSDEGRHDSVAMTGPLGGDNGGGSHSSLNSLSSMTDIQPWRSDRAIRGSLAGA